MKTHINIFHPFELNRVGNYSESYFHTCLHANHLCLVRWYIAIKFSDIKDSSNEEHNSKTKFIVFSPKISIAQSFCWDVSYCLISNKYYRFS